MLNIYENLLANLSNNFGSTGTTIIITTWALLLGTIIFIAHLLLILTTMIIPPLLMLRAYNQKMKQKQTHNR